MPYLCSTSSLVLRHNLSVVRRALRPAHPVPVLLLPFEVLHGIYFVYFAIKLDALLLACYRQLSTPMSISLQPRKNSLAL